MKKSKDFILLGLTITLVVVGTASALPMPLYNSLRGYDGHHSQENSPDQPQFLLNDGLDVSWVYDGTSEPVANETIIFTSEGALFGRVCLEDDGRNYIRTVETNNISASFDAFVTVINFEADEDHNVFLGVGAGQLGWNYGLCPDWGNDDVKTVWVELMNAGSPRENVINYLVWDGTSEEFIKNEGKVTYATVYRLKMSYDAYAQTIVFMVDVYNDGTWDCQTDVINIEGLFTEGDVSKVYTGADDEAILVDFEVKPTDPYMAYNFDPADGTSLVTVDKILSWELVDPDNTEARFDVYMGTGKNEGDPDYYGDNKVLEMTAETNYDPVPDLSKDTTYYWRVDVLEPNNIGVGYIIHTGVELNFTTVPLTPVITAQPASQTVEIGGSAVFTVEGLNFEDAAFAWYKVDNPTILSDQQQLIINDVQVADEERYYCEVSNDYGTAVSDTAGLWTKRLVAHWTFDDTLDSSQPLGPIWTGICIEPNEIGGGGRIISPSYDVDNISGKSLRLGADPNHVRITDSEDFFNFYPNGFTASAWVKPNEADAWQQFALSKNNQTESAGWGLGLFSDYQAFANIRSPVPGFDEDYYGGSGIDDGNWHLVTCQYNPDSATYSLFSDGTRVAESQAFTVPVPLSEDIVVIGAETISGVASFGGLVDDVKIWSYLLSPLEIAAIYTKFIDEDVCIEMTDAWRHFDTVGLPGEESFCRIDIEDFAEFALVWMKCNLTPSCMP
jgi:hypothetical protein